MSATAQIESEATHACEAMRASEPWKRLTVQQRAWVTAYVSNGGDHLAATRTAYRCSSEKTAQCMSYEVRKHPDIVETLFYAKSDRERLILIVETNLKSAAPGSVAASHFTAQLKSLLCDEPNKAEPTPENENPDHRFKVGDICVQNHQTYRVTSIDANGQPLTADEVTL
jgi:hypothetical protein